VSGTNAKMPKELTLSIQSQSDDSAQVEFSKVNTSYFDLLRTIKEEAKKNGLSNNGQLHAKYLGVLKDFKAFIKNNPQSPLAVVALTTAANGYGVFRDYEEMKDLLNKIMTNGKLDQLKDAAKDLMVDYYRKTKDYDGAIIAADAFVKDCKGDSELVADVMFKKGLILYYDKKKPGDAATCFSTIVKNYPGTAVASFAQNQLQSLEGQANESADSTGLAASQGIIMANYPNPFNPSTTIRYQIPNAGHVTLKVYDMLGREVAILANGIQEAGYHTATFDGSKLSSGIYFVRFTATPQNGIQTITKTMKMLMVK
jgi:tetratricopeptide (TPR) repeat protein